MRVVVLTAKYVMQMPTVALRRPVYSSDALKIFKTASVVLSVYCDWNSSKCGLFLVISILLLSSDHWNCGVGSPSNVKLISVMFCPGWLIMGPERFFTILGATALRNMINNKLNF